MHKEREPATCCTGPYTGFDEDQQARHLATLLQHAKLRDACTSKLREVVGMLIKANEEPSVAAEWLESELDDVTHGHRMPTMENLFLSNAILHGVRRKTVIAVAQQEGAMRRDVANSRTTLRNRHSATRTQVASFIAANGSITLSSPRLDDGLPEHILNGFDEPSRANGLDESCCELVPPSPIARALMVLLEFADEDPVRGTLPEALATALDSLLECAACHRPELERLTAVRVRTAAGSFERIEPEGDEALRAADQFLRAIVK